MASHIQRGESLLIPFRNGISISDSQLRPRMYKTQRAFEKAFPKHYLGTDGVELVEYAPVVHGRCKRSDGKDEWYAFYYTCLECGTQMIVSDEEGRCIKPTYCPNCGAKMDGRSEGE